MRAVKFHCAVLCILFFGLLSSCSKQADPYALAESTAEVNTGKAPLIHASENGRYIPDAYIVVLNDEVKDVAAEAEQLTKAFGAKADRVYQYVLKGFSATLSPAAVEALRNNPRVAYIEQDQQVGIETTQTSALSWGLDRIDQTSLPLDNTYYYNYDGSTIDAYIFDTGILLSHQDFGGRAVTGFDAVTTGGSAIDGNGHGTHVSGTIGGTTYGVAKNIRLIAVRVLDNAGSGTMTGVLAGIDWAVNNHTTKPAVGNMSLAGGASATLDSAVRRLISDGIVMCIAAGNNTTDAINTSPARVTEAITVGATTSTDGFASYSNYGSVVDILAPGSAIISDGIASNTATNTLSGTSMATPHVTGSSALLLEANPGFTPAQIQSLIKSRGISSKISGVPSGTVNLLLNSFVGTVSFPAPASPSLLSPANANTGISLTPQLSWNAVNNASTYNVQVSTASDFATTVVNRTGLSGTTLSLTALAGNTTYYWRASAANIGGNGDWSPVWSFTTLTPVKPATPVLVSPSNLATAIRIPVAFSWLSASAVSSYKLQISTSLSFSTIAFTGNYTSTSASIGGLKKNTTYYWRVRSLDVTATLNSDWSTGSRFTTGR